MFTDVDKHIKQCAFCRCHAIVPMVYYSKTQFSKKCVTEMSGVKTHLSSSRFFLVLNETNCVHEKDRGCFVKIFY